MFAAEQSICRRAARLFARDLGLTPTDQPALDVAGGLVTPGFLLKQWRYAIVISFLVTALITPGDVVSAQLILGVPMTLLYFISVGLSFFVARRRAVATAVEEHRVPQS